MAPEVPDWRIGMTREEMQKGLSGCYSNPVSKYDLDILPSGMLFTDRLREIQFVSEGMEPDITKYPRKMVANVVKDGNG